MLDGFNMRSLFLEGTGWVCWFVRHTQMWGRGMGDQNQPGLPRALLGANIQMLLCSISNSCRNG